MRRILWRIEVEERFRARDKEFPKRVLAESFRLWAGSELPALLKSGGNPVTSAG
jgi:hypothetical protein